LFVCTKKEMLVTSFKFVASTDTGTTAPFSAIFGALNLNVPLAAADAALTVASDVALKESEAAKIILGVRSPAPTAVATAELAIALFKNNLLFIVSP
jgi:hypothetical protein